MKRILLLLFIVLLAAGCAEQVPAPSSPAKPAEPEAKPVKIIERESKIPPDQKKITPATDLLPPLVHSDEYSKPVPVAYPINTAGAEDSGFVMPDGNTFYFWFTPVSGAPLGNQLDDGVTGIYMSKKSGGTWQKPEKIILQDQGKQSLDGCAFIQDCVMWFCTARTGYTGLHWFTASCQDGKWANWKNADFNPEYEVGELHITADGRELYFHSPRVGGKGQYDIWVSRNGNGTWLPPQNIEIINSPENDGWPSLTQDGKELWFTRTYKGSPAIFRSKKINNLWQKPELMFSQFAGESSIDNDGNVYFTHHFYKDGVVLEADIYIAHRK